MILFTTKQHHSIIPHPTPKKKCFWFANIEVCFVICKCVFFLLFKWLIVWAFCQFVYPISITFLAWSISWFIKRLLHIISYLTPNGELTHKPHFHISAHAHNLINEKSTCLQVMFWCHQGTSVKSLAHVWCQISLWRMPVHHYLTKFWPFPHYLTMLEFQCTIYMLEYQCIYNIL